MKRLLVIVFLSVSVMSTSAQEGCQYDLSELRSNYGYMLYYDKDARMEKAVNGIVCSIEENRKYAFSYLNGKLEGVSKTYENGVLREETLYKDGKREGIKSIFTEEGKLWGRIIYKNDKMLDVIF